MSGMAMQRRRILKVREIEHRAAALRLNAAERSLGNLMRIAERLGDLKRTLPATGLNGQMLNALSEMSQRIDDAQRSLERPIDDARVTRSRVDAERVMAKVREDGLARMVVRAQQSDEESRDRRADANRPRIAAASARKRIAR